MGRKTNTAMDRAVRAAICAATCRREAARLFAQSDSLLRAAERYTALNQQMCERALRDAG